MPVTSSAATDSQRWRSVEIRMRQLGHRPEGLIEVLHTVQETFGHLPVDALERVAASLGVGSPYRRRRSTRVPATGVHRPAPKTPAQQPPRTAAIRSLNTAA